MKWQYYDTRTMTAEEYEIWYAQMASERQEKTDAMRRDDHRKASVTADHLARTMIAEACGVVADSIRFRKDENGKPHAVDLPIHFNVSHSGDFVACAVDNSPVGIDIEQIRSIRPALVKKVCTEAERAYVEDLEGNMLVRFFEVWTSKEAWFKYIGTGITDLKSVDTLDHIRKGGCARVEDYVVSIYRE